MSSTQYIKTPIVKPLIKRKFAATLTKDITKLSTYRILCFLYKRHSVGVWQVTAISILVAAILIK